jgi:methylmalonyl-CoA mutase N-terminal domain/subunit
MGRSYYVESLTHEIAQAKLIEELKNLEEE